MKALFRSWWGASTEGNFGTYIGLNLTPLNGNIAVRISLISGCFTAVCSWFKETQQIKAK